MKIAYFVPQHAGAVIFGGMQRGFEQLGYPLHQFKPGGSYDYVLLFNCADHKTLCNFEGIDDITGKFGFIDTSEYGWQTHYEYYKDKLYSAFAPLTIGMKPDGHKKLINFLRNKSYPYFLREYYKGVNYHKNYHPIDYPLYWASVCKKGLSSFEEYKNRPMDLYVAWGESHQTRKNITAILEKLPLKMHVSVGPKIPPQQYFMNLESARMSVSYDGYGYGSFRETELLSRLTYFRNRQIVHQHHPLTDGLNFVEYTTEEILDDNHYPEFIDSNIGDIIMDHADNIDLMYEMYVSGYRHCLDNFTEMAVAKYILKTLRNHNWNEITSEEVTFINKENYA